jgi:pyridoxamine 5'-phosphate oxidase
LWEPLSLCFVHRVKRTNARLTRKGEVEVSETEALAANQLADSQIPSGIDPFVLFDQWFALAQSTEPNDPNAVALATASPEGLPSVRMVLLKGHGISEGAEFGVVGGGFTFFTNAGSRKGEQIRSNMQAALLFHWKSQRRQIRLEGPLIEVSPARADAYFHSRPYKSQVGSAASDQSRTLPERQVYLDRVQALWAQHEAAGQVPRPVHWTGFTLSPRRIEFWMDRDNRLHDRREFVRASSDAPWSDSLLYP